MWASAAESAAAALVPVPAAVRPVWGAAVAGGWVLGWGSGSPNTAGAQRAAGRPPAVQAAAMDCGGPASGTGWVSAGSLQLRGSSGPRGTQGAGFLVLGVLERVF